MAKYLSRYGPVIIEGAFSGVTYKEIDESLKCISKKDGVKYSSQKIKPFNISFSKDFYEHLNLEKQNIPFDFFKNRGFPVAIKYDLDNNPKIHSFSKKIEKCLDGNEEERNTVLLLSLLYSIENRHIEIVKIADYFGCTLNFDSLIKNNIVNISESICELSHPRISQFLFLTKRQQIFCLIRNYYSRKEIGFNIQVDLSSLSYITFFQHKEKITLLNGGISFVLSELSKNNVQVCDQAISFVENGLKGVENIESYRKIRAKTSLLRLQIDTLLCRWSGIIEKNNPSIIEIIFSAQIRMRKVELREAIGLAEFAKAMINSTNTDCITSDWLSFAAQYIKLSCLITSGEFDSYGVEYEIAREIIPDEQYEGNYLLYLLPSAHNEKHEAILNYKNQCISGRYKNNYACSVMMDGKYDKHVLSMLKQSIEVISLEGSLEITFPINNLGLYYLYSINAEEAVDIFLDMISYCITPYDYFTAYNNIAIALGNIGEKELALKYILMAHEYIESGRLQDPVFVIKSYFNKAVLELANGSNKAWLNMGYDSFDFESLPSRYYQVFGEKMDIVSTRLDNRELLTNFASGKMELSSALWPQNIQFWDFMYPVVTVSNINSIIETGFYKS